MNNKDNLFVIVQFLDVVEAINLSLVNKYSNKYIIRKNILSNNKVTFQKINQCAKKCILKGFNIKSLYDCLTEKNLTYISPKISINNEIKINQEGFIRMNLWLNIDIPSFEVKNQLKYVKLDQISKDSLTDFSFFKNMGTVSYEEKNKTNDIESLLYGKNYKNKSKSKYKKNYKLKNKKMNYKNNNYK